MGSPEHNAGAATARYHRKSKRIFGGNMDLQQAFSGIKVLAVARIVAAPFAAYQLAMHGADVIHIENKRSMTLVINTPQGQEVFRRLAKTADVVIENLKGGTMARIVAAPFAA